MALFFSCQIKKMVQKLARWLLAKPSIDSQPTMQLAKLVLSKLFPRIQLGLHRAGSERYYRLQAFLEKQQNDCVAMSLDIKNAFNTRSCVKMAESLFSTPSTHPIWHLFHWAYCDSSHLNLYRTYLGHAQFRRGYEASRF